ncbi:MAG: peptidase S1 [Chloroflexi bacterium]|nr:MAG: peptidase S1 [Chloroflexota bacterium]
MRSRRGWGIGLVLAALIAAGCSTALLRPAPSPVRTVAPTFTPTAVPAAAPAAGEQPAAAAETPAAVAQAAGVSASTPALVSAAGLDIAEQRVVDVYQRVSPAVVSITTQVMRRDFFFDVVPEEGAGSGFVIDQAGHILTNYHVIEGAERIEVNFGDDTPYPAEVVGVDPRNDVAVIRADAPADLLVPVELGTSANLVVGQRAIAIGNPFGQFGRTLTTGVISALDRTLEGQDGRTITGVIQTDAAINRGNSGGPLLDSSGRVIGINSAIFSPTGTSAGVGFSVPIDTVRRLLPDLLTLGRYRHPWLGIRYAYAVTPGLAELLKLPVDHGLLLVQLYEGSPLALANVRGAQDEAILGNQRVYIGGDILVAVDGQPIGRIQELEILLEDNHRVGDTVNVKLMRGTEEYTIAVQLAEEPN